MKPETMNMQRRSRGAPGRRIGRPGRIRGQSITEFVIVIPVLLLLVLGILQLALIYITKSTLNQAAMTGARQGAVENASLCAIRHGVVKGLTPLYLDIGKGNNPANYAVIRGTAWAKTMLGTLGGLDNVKITILNPSKASFSDFAKKVNGKTEIPNSRLLYRNTGLGSASHQTIQDANLLKIRVQYCRKLIVPYVAQALELMHKSDSGFTGSCYAAGGAALQADATVLMQSPARKSSTLEKIGVCAPF